MSNVRQQLYRFPHTMLSDLAGFFALSFYRFELYNVFISPRFTWCCRWVDSINYALINCGCLSQIMFMHCVSTLDVTTHVHLVFNAIYNSNGISICCFLSLSRSVSVCFFRLSSLFAEKKMLCEMKKNSATQHWINLCLCWCTRYSAVWIEIHRAIS